MELNQESTECCACALRLIKFRPRSERELKDKLQRKGYLLDAVNDTLAYCRKHHFIDDELFARAWTQGRIKRPFGLNRILYELYAKGVKKEIIDHVIQEVKREYREEEIIHDIIKNKWKKYQDIGPEKAKARLFGFLSRRGFSKDLVMEALSRL